MIVQAEPVVGDFGTEIYGRIIDEDGTVIDPGGASVLQGFAIRPDGSEEEIDIAPSPDATMPATPNPAIDPDPETNPDGFQLAGGWWKHTTRRYMVDGDDTSGPWMNKAGQWAFLAYYENGAGGWSTSPDNQTRIVVRPKGRN